MKSFYKNIAYLAFGLICVSCASEKEFELLQPQDEEGMQRLTITVGVDNDSDFIDTKADVNGNNGVVSFMPGDKIALFGDNTGRKYEFTTESGGKTASFTGRVDSKDNMFLVISPYSEDDPREGISLPCVQNVANNENLCQSVNLSYGTYYKTAEKTTTLLTPVFSLVKVSLDRNFRKVTFRSLDKGSMLCGNHCMVASLNEEGGHISTTKKLIENVHDYVSATSKAGRISLMMAALPCSIKNGFTVEFYEWEDDEFPSFSVTSSKAVELKAGTILDLGQLYKYSDYSAYVRYNSLDFGFSFCFNGETWTGADPYEDSGENMGFVSDLEYDYSDGHACPIPGQYVKLKVFIKGCSAADKVTLGDVQMQETSQTAVIGGEKYVAYTGMYTVPENEGKPLYLYLVINGVGLTKIQLPYAVFSKSTGIDYGGGIYTIGAEDFLVTNNSSVYDYHLCSQSVLDSRARWQIRPYDDGWVIYQDTVDPVGYKEVEHRWYLQYQDYRDIVYTYYGTDNFDKWAKWKVCKDADGYLYLTQEGCTLRLVKEGDDIFAGTCQGDESSVMYINGYDIIF